MNPTDRPGNASSNAVCPIVLTPCPGGCAPITYLSAIGYLYCALARCIQGRPCSMECGTQNIRTRVPPGGSAGRPVPTRFVRPSRYDGNGDGGGRGGVRPGW